MRKFDGLIPGTITPRPIRAPEPSHTPMLGATVRSDWPPTSMIAKIATAATSRITQSLPLRPSLPA